MVENRSDFEDERQGGVAVAEQESDDIPDPPPATSTGRTIRPPVEAISDFLFSKFSLFYIQCVPKKATFSNLNWRVNSSNLI